MRHQLSTSLAVMYTYALAAVVRLISGFVVRFFQVGAEFHERSRGEGIVISPGFLEKEFVEEGGEDVVGFGEGDALVGGLGDCIICVVVDLRLPVPPRRPRELRRLGVFERHDFAHGRVVHVEHVVEEAADVGDFAGGEARCKLGEGVRCAVDEGVHGTAGVLVAGGADFEVEVREFAVDGLYGVVNLGLRYVGC